MPVLAAPLFGFALGVLFAWAGGEEMARVGGHVTSRSLVVAALFGVVVYAPACGYFSASFPDWWYAYLVDSQRRPLALDVGAVLLDAASVPLGLAVVARSAASRRTPLLARAAAATSLGAATAILVTIPRLRVYATYAEFHGDFGTEPLTGSPVGYALIWMTVVVASAAAWTVHVLRGFAEP